MHAVTIIAIALVANRPAIALGIAQEIAVRDSAMTVCATRVVANLRAVAPVIAQAHAARVIAAMAPAMAPVANRRTIVPTIAVVWAFAAMARATSANTSIVRAPKNAAPVRNRQAGTIPIHESPSMK